MHPNQSLIKHAALWDKLWRAGKLSEKSMKRIAKGLTGDAEHSLNLIKDTKLRNAGSWHEGLIVPYPGGRHPKIDVMSLEHLGDFRTASKDWEMARPLESLGGISRNQMNDVLEFGTDSRWGRPRTLMPKLLSQDKLLADIAKYEASPMETWRKHLPWNWRKRKLHQFGRHPDPHRPILPTLRTQLAEVEDALGADWGGGYFQRFPSMAAVPRSGRSPVTGINQFRTMIGMLAEKGALGSNARAQYRDILRHELGHWKHHRLSQTNPFKLKLSARNVLGRLRKASPAHFDILQKSESSKGGIREILAEYFAGTGHGVGARRFRDYHLKRQAWMDPSPSAAGAWQRAAYRRYGIDTPLANPAHHIVSNTKHYLDDVPVKAWQEANIKVPANPPHGAVWDEGGFNMKYRPGVRGNV